MRSVTLKELADWIDKNQNHTWNFERPNYQESDLRIKYLDFSLDTRDMTVWRVETKGAGKDLFFRDDSDKGETILDALDKALVSPAPTGEMNE